MVKSDDIPTTICLSCQNNAIQAYCFKLLCNNSQKTLNNYLKLYYKLKEEENEEVEETIVLINQNFETEVNVKEEVAIKSDEEEEQEVKIEYGNSKLKCKICGKDFVSPLLLYQHRENVHRNDHLYECKDCDKTFSTLFNLEIHSVQHTNDKPYICEVCDKKFKTPLALTAHMSRHIGEIGSLPANNHENESSLMKDNLFEETIFFETKIEDNLELVRILEDEVDMKPIIEFHQENLFNNLPNGVKTRRRRQRRCRRRLNNSTHCKICNKYFSQPVCLERHLLTHTGVKSFLCSFCGKKFIDSMGLTIHTRVHTNERPYVCNVCGKRFIVSSNLNRHKVVHLGNDLKIFK